MATFHEFITRNIEENNLDRIKQYLLELTPSFLLPHLRNLDDQEKLIVFRLLDKEKAIVVFELLDTPEQKSLLTSFTDETALDYLARLEPDDRVRLLDEIPAKVARRLLMMLPEEKRQSTMLLMGYEPGTTGRIMSPEYVSLKHNSTVEEAIATLRRSHRIIEKRSVNIVYITDEARRFRGALPVSSIVAASPGTLIGDLIIHNVISASAYENQEKVARLLKENDLIEIPVVDRESRLIGVVTADDAMDILEQETTDDMFDKVGLLDLQKRESDRSHGLIHGRTFHVMRVRIPFLIITLIGGMLAGAVIGAFEEVLETVVAVAIFIPVIMDMGGNVGTQSSTIFTRAMVLGQINMQRFVRHWIHESMNGVAMGVVLGFGGGVVAALWQGSTELGWAVGLALTLTIILGVSLGFFIPYLLIKLGYDQAAGADPIITTIKDMSGLLIYFLLIQAILPQFIG